LDFGNMDDTDACVAMCKSAACGDGFVQAGVEACDDGNMVDDDACSNACAMPSCGDKIVQMGEECDDGNMDDTDACVSTCLNAKCGDGKIQAGVETCDDGMETAMCDTDCTAAMCGDGVVNMTAMEACDTKGPSMSCDGDCTAATCGDGVVNMAAGEACDDGNMVNTDACVMGCKAAKCGDGFVQAGVEACDDGNMVDNDACSNACKVNNPTCQGGSVEKSVAPGGNMKVCDHPADAVCEQDQETLCPIGWHLCATKEFNNRNTNWNYAVGGNNPNPVVVGEIYCRSGNNGAGHLSLGPYGITNLGTDTALNCGYGSSRDTCLANYGCNEKFVQALCCAPNPKCGNGVVDDVEEECDDGNQIESDECLNSCSWRNPTAHGLNGTGC
jgi:cysteine-rich repeat protein